MERTQTLKPGLLVSCATSVRGNVKYSRVDLEKETRNSDGTAHAIWQTEKTVRDAEEQAAAEKVRSEARNEIVKVCAHSSFGLLCPTEKRAELDAATDRALYMVRQFNAQANTTTVPVNVICGQIASTDEEAARALNRELVDLIADMQEGIASANPGAIREAAKRAKAMESMLSEQTAAKVSDAITQARKAARELVKRVEKGAESAADVVQEINTEALKRARMSFLDLDEENENAAPVEAIARGAEMSEPEPVEPEPEPEETTTTARDVDLFSESDPLADIPRTPARAEIEID